jgi:heavy metal sensor kinase
MKINLNIKSRLTLWYLVIIAIILVIFSTVTYFLLSESLYDIARKPSGLNIVSPTFIDTGTQKPDVLEQPILLISYTISKEWLETLQSEPASILSVHTPQGQMEIDQKDFISPDITGEQQVQLFLRSSPNNPSDSEVLAIVQPVSEVSDTLDAFKRVLVYVIPITALLAAIPGFLLIRGMLKPLNTITKTAREIGEKSLSYRIKVSNQDDELGRLAATLNWTFDKLQNALRRERQFTADASHELRTPLSIIRGETSLALLKERSPDEYRKSLGVITEEIDHMSSTINQLLTLARTDSGTEIINLNRINLAEFLTELASDVEVLCEEKSIKFKLNTLDRPVIEGDEVKLRELFLNLLDNAIQYTDTEGNITVSLNEENRKARIAISDTGVGIAVEHLPHIFERFYRTNKTNTENSSGAGLGLAICKSIVELHGGKIEVESKVGVGSKFTVILPLATTNK